MAFLTPNASISNLIVKETAMKNLYSGRNMYGQGSCQTTLTTLAIKKSTGSDYVSDKVQNDVPSRSKSTHSVVKNSSTRKNTAIPRISGKDSAQGAERLILPFHTRSTMLTSTLRRWASDAGWVLTTSTESEVLQISELSHKPVIVLGACPKLVEGEVIKKTVAIASKPKVVVFTETDDEPELVACLCQGAHHVIALPHCTGQIFQTLITSLHPRAAPCYAPYYFQNTSRSVALGTRTIQLSPKPFEVTRYLFANNGNFIPKEKLLRDLWGISDSKCLTRRIETQISRIKHSLYLDGSYGWQVRTHRRGGYGVFRISKAEQAVLVMNKQAIA